MSRKLTTSEVEKRLRKINVGVEVLGKYKTSSSPLKCRCRKCKHRWSPTWNDLSRGHGCPQCGGNKKLSTHEVRRRLKELNPSIEVLGEYVNSGTTIECRCRVCKTRWSPLWTNLSQGHGCRKCNINSRASKKKLTPDKINLQLKRMGSTLRLTGKYKTSGATTEFTCSKCGSPRRATWDTVKENKGICRVCEPHRHLISEQEVRRIVEDETGWKFPPETNLDELKGREGRPLRLDGYNKRHRTAFEYQGEQHYLPLWGGKQALRARKLRDKRKRFQCNYHGITLIVVPYWKDEEGVRKLVREKLGIERS